MSIGQGLTLITGETGSGKTAQLVSWLMDNKERPVFTMGIPELKVDHQPVPPVAEWTELRPSVEDPSILLPYFTFPPNSIVVIDEAQRVWRPRPVGSKPPPEIQAFETRRHVGVDFVVMTQHPSLLDSNIRRLVNRHIHIHCTFLGRYRLEWKGPARDPESKTDRAEASRTRYKPPKRAFPMYKSAEVHTKPKINRPWYLYAFPVLLLALIWGGLHIKNKLTTPAEAPKVAAAPGSSSSGKGAGASGPITAAQYVALYRPRIEDLPHTAPAYDEVTKPADAPVPVGCIDSKRTGCKCYTQQGTRYQTSDAMCRQIMANNGLYRPWHKDDKPAPIAAAAPVVARGATESPSYSVIGSDFKGSHNHGGGLSLPPPKSSGAT